MLNNIIAGLLISQISLLFSFFKYWADVVYQCWIGGIGHVLVRIFNWQISFYDSITHEYVTSEHLRNMYLSVLWSISTLFEVQRVFIHMCTRRDILSASSLYTRIYICTPHDRVFCMRATHTRSGMFDTDAHAIIVARVQGEYRRC